MDQAACLAVSMSFPSHRTEPQDTASGQKLNSVPRHGAPPVPDVHCMDDARSAPKACLCGFVQSLSSKTQLHAPLKNDQMLTSAMLRACGLPQPHVNRQGAETRGWVWVGHPDTRILCPSPEHADSDGLDPSADGSRERAGEHAMPVNPAHGCQPRRPTCVSLCVWRMCSVRWAHPWVDGPGQGSAGTRCTRTPDATREAVEDPDDRSETRTAGRRGGQGGCNTPDTNP